MSIKCDILYLEQIEQQNIKQIHVTNTQPINGLAFLRYVQQKRKDDGQTACWRMYKNTIRRINISSGEYMELIYFNSVYLPLFLFYFL